MSYYEYSYFNYCFLYTICNISYGFMGYRLKGLVNECHIIICFCFVNYGISVTTIR